MCFGVWEHTRTEGKVTLAAMATPKHLIAASCNAKSVQEDQQSTVGRQIILAAGSSNRFLSAAGLRVAGSHLAGLEHFRASRGLSAREKIAGGQRGW